jgi:general secretion pathway protein D
VFAASACLSACAMQMPPESPRAPAVTATAPATQPLAGSLTPETSATPRSPTILQGSGSFTSPSDGNTDALPASGDGFQLSFVDADVATVAGAILGDGLGVPFVVDPQVKGTITLQASRPLTREELLPTQRGSGFSIQIVSPRYVSASEIERLLQPFAPEGGILRVDENRNLLLLAGTGQEINTMIEVIKTFDVDWLAGMSFGLFPLEYVDARTIVTELESVFGDIKGPLGGIVRFTPLGRRRELDSPARCGQRDAGAAHLRVRRPEQ